MGICLLIKSRLLIRKMLSDGEFYCPMKAAAGGCSRSRCCQIVLVLAIGFDLVAYPMHNKTFKQYGYDYRIDDGAVLCLV